MSNDKEDDEKSKMVNNLINGSNTNIICGLIFIVYVLHYTMECFLP